jgi:hypothetical protein
MRIQASSKRSGSAILATLSLGTILCIMIGSYLLLARNQDASVARAMAWNAGIPIAEAGIEEGITQVHYNGITNLSANGWNLTNGVYVKNRYIGSNYFCATIVPSNPPIITSSGYVPVPKGVLSSTTYVKRTVQVTNRRDGLFNKGMVAKGKIDFNGNNVRTDSFDSSNTNYSTGGRYVLAKAKSNGDVATDLELINSINVGNANIYGHVSTGPNGTVSIGANGGVGDFAWQSAHPGLIQDGWVTDDMNVSFPDVNIPYTSAWTPGSGIVNGQTYTYVLTSKEYIMNSLSLKSKDVLYVAGNATLYVTGNVSVAGNGVIEIGPSGSLMLYVGGSSASISGNGIVNQTGNATNCVYLGLNTNTSLDYSGNASFTGLIYAPYADFHLGGGGTTYYDFVGSSVSSTVKMNGHFNFHYDEALANSKWGRGFVITGWREI